MDLAQLVADERWEALDDYIQGLPPNNRLNEAMANDPEYAEMYAMQEESTEKWSPRLSQWDLHATMLKRLIGAVDGVQSAVIASAGGTPPKNREFPGPVTEVDNARERVEKMAQAAILEMAGFDPALYL